MILCFFAYICKVLFYYLILSSFYIRSMFTVCCYTRNKLMMIIILHLFSVVRYRTVNKVVYCILTWDDKH